MSISIAPKRSISSLRQAIFGFVLASSSIFLMPAASAQDAVYFKLGFAPVNVMVVVTDYVEFEPYENCGFTWVGMAEIVILGGAYNDDPSISRGRIAVEVAVENPLRTLKRGDRLNIGSGAEYCLGSWILSAQVT